MARTVRALWPDMSVRLVAEGYQGVKPNWLDQFDDADVAYLIHNVCADAPRVKATEENPERLANAALTINDVVDDYDMTAMTGVVIIATTEFCPEEGERLGIK